MLSTAEKLATASRLKEEANALVQAKEYKKACSIYRRIFAYTNGLVAKEDGLSQYAESRDILTKTEELEITKLKVVAYTNLALCYLRQDENEKAYEAALKALELDPVNVKALFRKGCACIQLRRWDQAKEALLRALEIEPGNSSVKNEIANLKSEHGKWMEEQRTKEKLIFGGKLL